MFDTQSEEVQRNHSKTIPRPHRRYELIERFVQTYLRQLRFGNMTLKVSASPSQLEQRMFSMPDFEFGNKKVLSARGTPNAQQVSLDSVGKSRAALLRDKTAGFYVTDPLDRQYLFLPQTIADSLGERYRGDLVAHYDGVKGQV